MQANHFIQKHTLERAKKIVENAPDWADVYLVPMAEYTFIAIHSTQSDDFISISELKLFIESVDYLNEWYSGKIDDAYDHVERMHGMLKLKPQFPNLYDRIKLVEGHLSNYESIYGGGDE
ncbi:hypothetical protein [Acinetobacter calcoaceticus]|uniref:hypothetical protein n=1 Tax=Acinetobacter calcoaceticus TaxID=471 RepID=UPI003A85B011